MNYVVVWHVKVKVIEASIRLIEVGLVDEVPVGLEAAKRGLDIVGEGGALSEWVVPLVLDDV